MNQIETTPYRSSFLAQQAEEAWKYFSKTGYPTSRDENWRFSNPNPWLLKSAPFAAEGEEFSMEEFSNYIIPDTLPIFIVNNTISISNQMPVGIQVMDMIQAVNENFVNGFVGSVIDSHFSPFSAENTALFQNGVVINVPENMVVEKPLQLIHLIRGNTNSRIYPRVYVNIEPGSEIQIIQTEIGDDEHHHFVNSVIETVVHENAKLKWTLMQQRNSHTGQISSFNIKLGQNAAAIYNTYEFGGGFIRRDINAYLHSKGGDFEINSLFVPTAKQHMDIFSIVHHESPHSTSRQLVKGVLGGSSSGVFRGLAHVYPDAKKSNAQQTNHNLLLSSKSRMNSIPQLQIYEDDVKCSHGSTTGQLNKEAIFYLRSRGIDRMAAIGLMVKGFANEVVDKIENNKLKANIQKALVQKMDGII